MPADLFSRIDLDQIYLPFLERVLQVVADCRDAGHTYYAISGYRSPAEQARLYFQGRITPGKIVTNAKPWQSPHQFGLAIDFCADADTLRKHLQPDWRPESYDALGEACRTAGLAWGGTFKRPDRPHVQWPGYVTAHQLAPLKNLNLMDAWKIINNPEN